MLTKSYQGRLPRLVPWTNWTEWLAVHAWLSSTMEDQQRAIKRIAAWRARGRLPLAIEASAALCEAKLAERTGRTEGELRLMYSMAITRFVNGTIEEVQRGQYAAPLSALADRIGLPLALVDLRHEVTHKQLPSLPMLKLGADKSLDWLVAHYWLQQQRQLVDFTQATASLLAEYSATKGGQLFRKIAKTRQKKKKKKQKAKADDASTTESALSSNAPTSTAQPPEDNTATLISDIVNITSPNGVKEVLIPLLLDNNLMIPVPTLQPTSSNAPPPTYEKTLITIWGDALSQFDTAWPHFSPLLLLSIVDRMINKSRLLAWNAANRRGRAPSPEEQMAISVEDSQLRCLAFWAEYLLQHLATSPMAENSPNDAAADRGVFSEREQRRALADSALRAVVEACLSAALETVEIADSTMTSYVSSVLECTLKSLSTSDVLVGRIRKLATFREQVEQIMGNGVQNVGIIAASTNQSETADMDFENLEKAIREVRFTDGDDDVSSTPNASPWKQCTVWTPCPIGLLPGGTLPDLSLSEWLDSKRGPIFLRVDTESLSAEHDISRMSDIEDTLAPARTVEMMQTEENEDIVAHELQTGSDVEESRKRKRDETDDNSARQHAPPEKHRRISHRTGQGRGGETDSKGGAQLVFTLAELLPTRS